MKPEDKLYCGVILIGGGSSWGCGPTPQEAADRAAKFCRQDWGKMFDLKGKELAVNILDMRKRDGWVCDHRGFRDSDTDEQIDVMEVIRV